MDTIKKIIIITVLAISFNSVLGAEDVVKYDKPKTNKPVFTVNKPDV